MRRKAAAYPLIAHGAELDGDAVRHGLHPKLIVPFQIRRCTSSRATYFDAGEGDRLVPTVEDIARHSDALRHSCLDAHQTG